MIKAKYTFPNSLKPSIVNFPDIARGLTREGERPNKCVITGCVENENPMELSKWADMVKKALSRDGKLIIDTDKYPERKYAQEEPENKSSNPIMQFFNNDHLPEKLQEVSARIGIVAHKLDQQLPESPEKSAGLRKLLEAKDCFVRASFAE